MIKKNCLICGKEFNARNIQEKYCREDHIIKCKICGKDIHLDTNLKKSGYVQQHRYITCSQKCAKIMMMQTNENKYGFKTPFSNPMTQSKIKEKQSSLEYRKKLSNSIKEGKSKTTPEQKAIIKYKIEQTKFLRYKDKHYTNKGKRLKTMNARYGVDYSAQCPEILNKMQNTCCKRYGVKVASSNYEISNKISIAHKNRTKQQREESFKKAQVTYRNKTGYDWFSQCHLSKDTLEIIHNKDKFIEYIKNLPEINRTIKIIANNLKLSYSYTHHLIKNYNIDTLLNINYYISSLEIEVKNFISELENINYELKNRTVIYPYELDIYIPDKQLALEINGTYYHSDKFHDKNYHYNKSKLCEEKGIRLIHIWEYEWYNSRQRPILENIIKNALGSNEHKLYARKLDIEVRPSNIMKEFFEKNNIQGFRGGKFAICLVDKSQGEFDLLGNYIPSTGKVYMAYMMGKAFFGKGKYEWEVIRGATELGYTIIGGASKIFKYFIKTYNPKNCVYYIDYNYFNGNSLKNLPKMEFIKTQPSFKNYFMKEGVIKNRDPMHHKEITEGYKDGSILQIWNAGTKVYVWKDED